MTLIVSRDESGKVSVSFTAGDTSFSTSAQDGQGASWTDAYAAERQPDEIDTPAPAAAPGDVVQPPDGQAVEQQVEQQQVERNAGQHDTVPAVDPQPVVEEQSAVSPTGSSTTDPAAPTTEGL